MATYATPGHRHQFNLMPPDIIFSIGDYFSKALMLLYFILYHRTKEKCICRMIKFYQILSFYFLTLYAIILFIVITLSRASAIDATHT